MRKLIIYPSIFCIAVVILHHLQGFECTVIYLLTVITYIQIISKQKSKP